jgi:hypothetical protein
LLQGGLARIALAVVNILGAVFYSAVMMVLSIIPCIVDKICFFLNERHGDIKSQGERGMDTIVFFPVIETKRLQTRGH